MDKEHVDAIVRRLQMQMMLDGYPQDGSDTMPVRNDETKMLYGFWFRDADYSHTSFSVKDRNVLASLAARLHEPAEVIAMILSGNVTFAYDQHGGVAVLFPALIKEGEKRKNK
jgi:hypothetical protein